MVTINYVWMGKGPLGPLERFNIYSWRCLGYNVAIYTFHFTRGQAFTFSSLGLSLGERVQSTGPEHDDLAVVHDAGLFLYDMPTLLREDEYEDDGSGNDPRRLCREMRRLLATLYDVAQHGSTGVDAVDLDPDYRRDQIFNVVDLTKSYLGATRRGLTMDFKVGPSPHLAEYEPCFDTKFISFKRGNLVVGNAPENQCLGTNQAANTIRCNYATHFNKWVAGWSASPSVVIPAAATGILQTPRGKHYDKITLTHAKFFTSFQYRRDCLNVTVQAPDGTDIMQRYRFRGIADESGQGPFRVFKKATDQTNQSSGEKTTPFDVKHIAAEVMSREVDFWPNWDSLDQYYKEKLDEAYLALPRA